MKPMRHIFPTTRWCRCARQAPSICTSSSVQGLLDNPVKGPPSTPRQNYCFLGILNDFPPAPVPKLAGDGDGNDAASVGRLLFFAYSISAAVAVSAPVAAEMEYAKKRP